MGKGSLAADLKAARAREAAALFWSRDVSSPVTFPGGDTHSPVRDAGETQGSPPPCAAAHVPIVSRSSRINNKRG